MSASPLLHAFKPIADKRAHTLILGSMPGEASLHAGQYYAHSRNLFWPMVAEIMGFSADLRAELHERKPSSKMPEALYAKCCDALLVRGCALWDVLATCERTGSLDADIRNGQPNDFPAFFATKKPPCGARRGKTNSRRRLPCANPIWSAPVPC